VQKFTILRIIGTPSFTAGVMTRLLQSACLDHSAGQQYRLNSGLFILSYQTCVRGFSLTWLTIIYLLTYYNKKIPAFIFFAVVFPVYFLPS